MVDLMSFDLTGIKSFTRFWALLMFGSYSVINIIVLLNMLIAMMSNSYQIISVIWGRHLALSIRSPTSYIFISEYNKTEEDRDVAFHFSFFLF
jgi:hypothetical protein